MKIRCLNGVATMKTMPARNLGLTLVEMMITMGISSIAICALIYTQMFTMKQDQLVESKLGASDHARIGFEKLANEIRSANSWSVGNMSGSAYSVIGNGFPQRGNAIQICLSTNTSTNIIYYFDTSTPGNFKLHRKHTGDAKDKVIADHLINTLSFVIEDYAGNTNILDTSDRRLIHFTLDFCQYQYPMTKIGKNYLYDRYKIDFKLTPHVPGGR